MNCFSIVPMRCACAWSHRPSRLRPPHARGSTTQLAVGKTTEPHTRRSHVYAGVRLSVCDLVHRIRVTDGAIRHIHRPQPVRTRRHSERAACLDIVDRTVDVVGLEQGRRSGVGHAHRMDRRVIRARYTTSPATWTAWASPGRASEPTIVGLVGSETSTTCTPEAPSAT